MMMPKVMSLLDVSLIEMQFFLKKTEMHSYPCTSFLVESVNHSQLADLMMTNGAWNRKMTLLSCRAGQVN
jgi:hypothetical protein